MTSKLLLVVFSIFSSSLFGQYLTETQTQAPSKFSINSEASTIFEEGLSSVLIGAEHQYFQNQKGNLKANARAGLGTFKMRVIISEISGNCGFIGTNLLLGKVHHFETNLCVLAGINNGRDLFFSSILTMIKAKQVLTLLLGLFYLLATVTNAPIDLLPELA